MRLFFSWQSDIIENKKLLRKLLQRICKELNVEYTDDARDEMGGGHIVDALLRKIENSHVFVGDITIIGTLNNGRAVINSNVAYELGFAEAKLSRRALLLVINEEYGSYETMPFDLGKRIITRYKTNDNVLAQEDLQELRSNLKRRIKAYIDNIGTTDTLQVALNKSEKTLLYWATREGDGQIVDVYLSSGTYSHYSCVCVGNTFSKLPLHTQYDTKNEARLRNSLETLVVKSLLIKSGSSQLLTGGSSWVLSEEGELTAAAITEAEVYPLPKSLG